MLTLGAAVTYSILVAWNVAFLKQGAHREWVCRISGCK
jgi:hypothetical protein